MRIIFYVLLTVGAANLMRDVWGFFKMGHDIPSYRYDDSDLLEFEFPAYRERVRKTADSFLLIVGAVLLRWFNLA